jgi:hypothetical protein
VDNEKNILNLKADLPAIAAKINEKVSTIQRWAALRFFSLATQMHPVDTGYSRANWNIAKGEPDASVLPRQYWKLVGTSKSRVKVRDSYATPTPPEVPDPEGEPLYVTNSVDYVQYLEEGHSKQAPSGFIRISAEKVASELEAKVAEVAKT